MDHLQTCLDALEQQMHTVNRRRRPIQPTHPTGTLWQRRFCRSLWSMTWPLTMVTVFGLSIFSFSTVQARTFQCPTGDVACLIASIIQANVQPGQAHEIRLEAGVYTLTEVHNTLDGANGLPSITSHLTIRG